MRRRGLSLVEAVVAVMVLATGGLAYLSVARTSTRAASQSRNYAMASLVAQNVIEEIGAHIYGQPRPNDWLEFSPLVIIEGRESRLKFEVSVESDPEAGGNGSFFGDARGDVDILLVKVAWVEPKPSDQGSRRQEISFHLPVRRENAL